MPQGTRASDVEAIRGRPVIDFMEGGVVDKPELQLWTIEDFARWIRVTPMAVRAILKRRQLPPEAVIKIGRRVRIRADLARNWVLTRQSA